MAATKKPAIIGTKRRVSRASAHAHAKIGRTQRTVVPDVTDDITYHRLLAEARREARADRRAKVERIISYFGR